MTHAGGSPFLLTPEVHENVVKAVRIGATRELAANYAGLSARTLYSYLARGRAAHALVEAGMVMDEAERPFFELYRDVKQAEGSAAIGWLLKIEQAAATQWQAAAWKLERRYTSDYGRQQLAITGADGGPIQVENVTFTDDEIVAILTAAKQTSGE
jgi:hypothetical protein